MQKIFLTVVALMMFICQSAFAEPSPQWVKNLPAAKHYEQMVVVAGIGKTTAWISMHEKINGDWQQIMSTPGFIGKNGLGKVREGDAKTPVGTFHFNYAFGIAADPGCAIPYTQVDANYYWSSDVNYKYNQMVDVREASATFDKANS